MYGRGTQGFGFGPPVTPPIIKQLLIANAVVFAAQTLARGTVEALGAVRPSDVWQRYELWQPFSYMWLHGGISHLAMNMLALWMFGSELALTWGPQRFLRYYLLCGVGAGFIIASYPYLGVLLGITSAESLGLTTIGASGAIFGVVLAYSFTWPDRRVMLIFPPVAFRAIWLIPILFVLELTMDSRGNVSHAGHLGGALVGWLYLHGGARPRASASGPSLVSQLERRLRRYRMRRKLRNLRWDEDAARRRPREEPRNDRTLH